MKPQVLTMTAFGPFKGETVIDFRPFYKNGIFTLSGVTGAGKSTVFDAICFALYGRAAQGKKSNDDLKSRFADDGVLCSVSLEFLAKGEVYKIERVPAQYAPGKRGKPVQTAAAVNLVLPTGEVLTAAEEVVDKIHELLQLDFSQFSKIVLLPQGEFQNFLLAKSSEKQTILSEIFDTDIYSRVTEVLKENFEEIRLSQAEVSGRIESYIAQIVFEGNGELQRAIEEDAPSEEVVLLLQQHCESAGKQITEVGDIKAKLQQQLQKKDLAAAKNNNALLDEFKQKGKELRTLQNRGQEIQEKQTQLENSNRAKTLQLMENNLKTLREHHCQFVTTRGEIAEKICALEGEWERLQPQIALLQAMEEQNNRRSEEVDRLKEKQRDFTAFLKSRERAKELKKKLRALEERADIQKEIAQCLKNKNERKKTEEQLAVLALIQSLAKEMKTLEGALAAKEGLYEKLNTVARENSAAFMAQGLQEGQPCPVCGSVHHPRVATMGEPVTEKELQLLRAEIQEVQKNLAQAAERRKALLDSGEIDGEEEISRRVFFLTEQLHTLEAEPFSDHLPPDKEMPALEELTVDLAVLENTTDQTRRESAVLQGEVSAGEEAFAPVLRQGEGALQEEILQLQQQHREAQGKIQALIKTRDELQYQLKTQRELLEKATLQAEQAKKQVEEAAQLFADKSRALGFSGEYTQMLLSESEESALREEVERYQKTESALTQRVDMLKEQTANIVYTNLQELEAEVTKLQQRLQEQEELHVTLQSTYQTNRTVLEKLQALNSKYHSQNKLYKDCEFLHKLSIGDNSARVSFERYVLSVYFGEILLRANVHLEEMTRGRYEMVRKETKARRGAYSGLDIEVIDYNNGNRRDITTLSGGETFLASLALALGLSEVIGNASAVADTEVLFIDEGFGSLDEQTLDITIGVLNKLKESGKLIGLISHVGLIKEQIDCKIEVLAGRDGSKVRVIY